MAKKHPSKAEDLEPEEDSELTINLEDSDDGSQKPAPVSLGGTSDDPDYSFSLEESDDGLVATSTLGDAEAGKQAPGFGALPPRYDLLLNRATARPFPICPRCSEKTTVECLSIFALVKAEQPLLFAHEGPLCPACELFIVHADVLQVPEEILESVEFLGTIEPDFARLCENEPRPIEELLAHLADLRSFSVIRDRGASKNTASSE